MNTETINEINYIYNHTSQDTAYLVDNYPWGFRLKTKIRYWIESKDSSNGGQRFVSQTINPKTGAWCAPKYSTYSALKVMYLDENSHIKTVSLNSYANEEEILKFKNDHLKNLDDFQKQKLKEIIGLNQAMKNVTFSVRNTTFLSEEEKKDIEENQKEIKKEINKYIQYKVRTTVL